jgi:hypothetical protein
MEMCRCALGFCAVLLVYGVSLAWTWGVIHNFRVPSTPVDKVLVFLITPFFPGAFMTVLATGGTCLLLLTAYVGVASLYEYLWPSVPDIVTPPLVELPPGDAAIILQ